jgi:signal transduction histidine kinase
MAARQHTLLVVDDEVDVLESPRHLFHRQYRVLTAGSGQEAVDLLQQNDVHLILSDQRMPGMTGDVFLGHARRLQPDAIRMLFTGYADIQAVINAVNEGYIFRYILKPWDAVELEGIVRQATEQYELIAERNRLIAELQAAKTNLERANQELTEAGQLKSAFIEVASHEFNTPITLLLGLSELLRLLDPERDVQERELIERISSSARQLAKLVANTLTLMRKDDFRRTLQRRPVDLGAVLGDVAQRVLPFVHARKLRFTADVPADLGIFQIDPEKIADVTVNLLTNAIKFTPDDGEIALRAALDGPDHAVIRVEDRGIGVEPKALAQFFQPFFTQFNPSHHSSGDFGFNKRGLGLGLSIVKQFVELHGGTVWAESAVGRGTQVAIRLPRRPPAPQGGELPPVDAASALASRRPD